jgi:hypothetical protein
VIWRVPRMNEATDTNTLIDDFIATYCEAARAGFASRWSQIVPDTYRPHRHEAVGALLARQVSLSVELARAPQIWNGHAAPLFLRSMTDAYITLAWMLEDLADRSTKYVEYGLGQEKLFIRYIEEELKTNTDPDRAQILERMLNFRKGWLNSQHADWATDVNLGAWSGMSTRDMAKDIKRESIYRFAYMPFSGVVHNMWQHVSVYNMQRCKNALHKWHLVPSTRDAPFDPDYMYRSAKYLSQSFELLDSKLATKSDVPLPLEVLVNHKLFSSHDAESEEKPPIAGSSLSSDS